MHPDSPFVALMFAGAARFVAVFHGLLIVFIVIGGFPAIAWPPLAWIHAPCAIWGIVITVFGTTCPLTPLEKWLRVRGTLPIYEGGYLDHYIFPIICPGGITGRIHLAILVGLVLVNSVSYGILFSLSGSP